MHLRISDESLSLDDKPVEHLKTTPAALGKIVGDKARVLKTEYNDIYTFDQRGVHVFAHPKTTQVHSVDVSIAKVPGLKIAAKKPFAGTLEWNGISFALPAEIAKLTKFVKTEAKKQKKKLDHSFSLRTGPFEIYVGMSDGNKSVVGLSIGREEEKGPPIELPKGKGVKFSDFNFKLLVLQELMYNQRVLTPPFDADEFAQRYTKREIDIDDEGYDIIPEIKKYFAAYPIPKDKLAKVKSLAQEGGDDIYMTLCPFWDGEDEMFDVKSVKDAALLPNLKKVVLFSSENDKNLEALKKRGIKASYL